MFWTEKPATSSWLTTPVRSPFVRSKNSPGERQVNKLVSFYIYQELVIPITKFLFCQRYGIVKIIIRNIENRKISLYEVWLDLIQSKASKISMNANLWISDISRDISSIKSSEWRALRLVWSIHTSVANDGKFSTSFVNLRNLSLSFKSLPHLSKEKAKMFIIKFGTFCTPQVLISLYTYMSW